MLIPIFLVAALNLTSGAPTPPSASGFGLTTSPAIFWRELPDCANVASYRSVQDIISSCLVTIFACTWVAVHPNVPRPQDSGWKRFKQRVFIMLYAILAPEFIVIWALRQRVGAEEHMREYNKKFYPSVTPPSRSTWWYFKRWFRHPANEKSDSTWTPMHGFLLEMHGAVDNLGGTIRSVDEISYPLGISEEDITDKSKGDFLTKSLVVVQTSWFILQCLTRWATHLPVTELEVVTLAFSLLNLGTYALWWNKPQNMTVAIRTDRYKKSDDPIEREKITVMHEALPERTVDNSKSHRPSKSKRSREDQPTQKSKLWGRTWPIIKQHVHNLNLLIETMFATIHPSRLPSLTMAGVVNLVVDPFLPLLAMVGIGDGGGRIYSSRYDYRSVAICFLVIGTVFGGLHLIPIWSSSFPSTSEKLLWELSAGLVTATPLISICLFFFEGRVFGKSGGLLDMCIFVVGALYLVARFVLIVLAFTTLRKLPRGAFRNIEWTTFIPHF